MDITGKIALVTGGGSGIGAGIAEALLESGARVVITDISPDHLDETVGRLGNEVMSLHHDVTSSESWQVVKHTVEAQWGNLDILCNNAGVSSKRYTFDELPEDDFVRLMNVNVMGVYYGVRAFVPGMRARGTGHVVNVSSINGVTPSARFAGYCASKFAVTALSEAMRDELEAEGIGVSVLYPGTTRSRMSLDPEVGAAASISDPVRLAAMMMDPIWLGRAVARGIERNKPHIFSHPGSKGNVERRFAGILDSFGEPAQPGFNPS